LRQSHVAKRYARAFVERVIDKPEPEARLGELKGVADLVLSNKKFRDFFFSPLFSAEEKGGILTAVIEKAQIQADVTHILRMLLQNAKFHLLSDVVAYSEQVLNERLRKAGAAVYSAVELSSEDLRRLGDTLNRITGKKTVVRARVDASILGGVKVKVGSVVYDGSLRGQLDSLKEDLIKG